MSNALAIATVTTALAQIMRTAALTTVAGSDVLTARPDATPQTEPRVRLFLYQVTPNAALRNRDLPTRSADGNLVRRPTIALDLHYLCVFYGNETALEPQRMLGAVARDLHATPVLTQKMITDAVASQTFLTGSNLADSIEQVKFAPLPLTVDETSKIWSTFFQTPYALSVAYQATVVLIESDDTGPAALPVLNRGQDDHGVDTLLGPFPSLDSVHIGEGGDDATRLRRPSYAAARLGAVVTIRGRNLGGDQVSLSLTHPLRAAPTVLAIDPANRSATQITLALGTGPADPAAQTAWSAGTYGLSVAVTSAGTTRSSNVVPLPVALQITQIAPPSPITGAGTDVTLTISCTPQALPGQRLLLLLADREVPAEAHAAPTGTLQFKVVKAPAVSKALLRLRADGVDSLAFLPRGTSPRLDFDDAQKVTIA